ncbi:hypothetical protein EVAR_80289_1 [Eumeta japonica]|uniref:Uncharacterized protein n=1 Tax=Eumeta variegata TaxID=151549 RepID=A0A4C1UCI9_EUMVA|nr:hypothetical protein EVAR_80289_1 [Eumeta japonica]
MVSFASTFVSSSINSLQSKEDLTCKECTGEQLVVDVDGTYKELSLSDCTASPDTFLVILLRSDIEGLEFIMVSYLNGDVEVDIFDGFNGDSAFSVDVIVVWTALLLNLGVVNA